MYTNDKLEIIQDFDAIFHNDIRYPSDYPKDEIKGLYKVTETVRPNNDYVVFGFHIDEKHTQVWDCRAKTEKELINEKNANLKQEIEYLEKEITSRRIREAMLTEEGKFWLEEKEKEINNIRMLLK